MEVKGHPDAAKNDRFYLFTNHLGSVGVVADDQGNRIGDVIRHEPFGDYRGTLRDE